MTHTAPDIYPTYSPAERWADGIVHGVAIVGALLGTLYVLFLTSLPEVHKFAMVVYGAIMVLSFTASAAYHFAPNEGIRPLLRRFDHAGIFLKIAATYTPLVALIATPFSYIILGVVWAIGLFGAARKLFFWQRPGSGSFYLYLGMGWLSVTLAKPVFTHLPAPTIWLVVIGGLTYSAGTVFYKAEQMRFSNAIWHIFVMVASGCFFAGILYGQTTLL